MQKYALYGRRRYPKRRGPLRQDQRPPWAAILAVVAVLVVGVAQFADRLGLTPGCDIKGNVSYNNGERIYHVPGGNDYDGTRIDATRGERWFCSEKEAQTAGWRRSGR